MSEFRYIFLKRKLQREIASFIRLQKRDKDFEEKKSENMEEHLLHKLYTEHRKSQMCKMIVEM